MYGAVRGELPNVYAGAAGVFSRLAPSVVEVQAVPLSKRPFVQVGTTGETNGPVAAIVVLPILGAMKKEEGLVVWL